MHDDEVDWLLVARPLDSEIGARTSQDAEVFGISSLNVEDPLTSTRSMKAAEELFGRLSLNDIAVERREPSSE